MRRLTTIAVLVLTLCACQSTPDDETPADPMVYVASGRIIYTAGLDICSDLVKLDLLHKEEAETAEEVRWGLAAALDEAEATVSAGDSLDYLTLRKALLAAQRLLVRVIERRLTEQIDEPVEKIDPEVDGAKVENPKLMALLLAASRLLGAGLQIEAQKTVSPDELAGIKAQQAAAEARWKDALIEVR